MIKRSLFSQIELTSDKTKELQSEVNKERKSFIESLSSEQMANLFPQGTNLGTLSNNKPITQTDIASQDGATQIATTPDGSTVMIDPKTGKPIIVSANPEDIEVKSPEDIEKLTQLAILARQAAQSTNPNQNIDKQQQTNQQTQASQKSDQQQQTNRIAEEKVDDIHSFMNDLNQIFSSGPLDKNKNPKIHEEYSDPTEVELPKEEQPEKVEEVEETKPEIKSEPIEEPEVKETPKTDDGLVEVEVDHIADNFTDMSDPMDTLNSYTPTFWQPSSPDLSDTVKQTQQTMGVNSETPVIEKPIPGMARPNMSQYVKTSMNRGPSVPGVVDSFSADDFSDVMGLDSPISIKLSLEVNK